MTEQQKLWTPKALRKDVKDVMNDQSDMSSTFQSLYALLDELRSIGSTDVLSTPYHPTLEAAYEALGKIETEIDALSQELEYQHQRLDSAREALLAEAAQENEKPS